MDIGSSYEASPVLNSFYVEKGKFDGDLFMGLASESTANLDIGISLRRY